MRAVLRLPRIAPIFVCSATLTTRAAKSCCESTEWCPTSLDIRAGVAIPLAEIELRTSRSSGPGGQHANVTASRVEAVFDVHASAALTDDPEGPHRGPPRARA